MIVKLVELVLMFPGCRACELPEPERYWLANAEQLGLLTYRNGCWYSAE